MPDERSEKQTAPDGNALASSAAYPASSASRPAPPLASRPTRESDSEGEADEERGVVHLPTKCLEQV